MDSQPVIFTKDLRKTYQEGLIRKRSLQALRGVCLDVNPGEVFGLLGPNGAGKTTLIKILLGIVKRTSGEASLLQHTAGSLESRQRVGYLPENLRISKHHTARTALEYYGRLSRMDHATIRSRSDELLELVGLQGRDRESVKRFSKGMGQRLGLAQALLHDPQLLILDEPTDGLDPVGRSQVRDILSELKSRGKTIFLNSHILQEVEIICDRVAILAKGEVKGTGSVEELRKLDSEKQLSIEVADTSDEKLRNMCDVITIEPSGDKGKFTLSMKFDSQAHVNQLVDTLRSNDVSIQKLEQTQATLEQVFLSLVDSEDVVEKSE